MNSNVFQMDCAAICLLTTAVQFLPLSSTVNCTYCVEARSTYEHCFKDVIECAYRDPSSLIICLNVYEKNGGDPAIVQHTIRCISYQDYYVPDDSIRQVSAGGSCAFEHIQKCECDVCRSPTTTTITTTTTQITPSMHKKKHHKHHHHKDGSSHNHKHDKLVYPNNTFAQQYRDSGYYLKSGWNTFSILPLTIFLTVVSYFKG
uniref:Protein quiver n=1 Tax=Caenorhabditis tropicalis TaxID=1561998 RepID=A0A1I7UPT0_9PELO